MSCLAVPVRLSQFIQNVFIVCSRDRISFVVVFCWWCFFYEHLLHMFTKEVNTWKWNMFYGKPSNILKRMIILTTCSKHLLWYYVYHIRCNKAHFFLVHTNFIYLIILVFLAPYRNFSIWWVLVLCWGILKYSYIINSALFWLPTIGIDGSLLV